MQDFEMPDIPDDDIKPTRPDIRWFRVMMMILISITILSIIIVYSFSIFIIWNISLNRESELFWDILLDPSAAKLDTSFLQYQLNLPSYVDLYIIDDDIVNAFAWPGANIYFTTGLLKKIKYEEEFLFILWHELGHIEHRDTLKLLTFRYPLQIWFWYFWYNIWYNSAFLNTLYSNYNSRNTENMWDKFAIDFMRQYNSNPNCIIPFFEELSSDYEKYIKYLSTHPTTESRINYIKNSLRDDLWKCHTIGKYHK